MTDRIVDIWGTSTPHPRGTPWPVREGPVGLLRDLQDPTLPAT